MHLTLEGTEVAINAFVCVNLELEKVPSGDNPEKSPQRTDVATPESFSREVEKNDPDEKRTDQKTLKEYGVDIEILDELHEDIADRQQFEPVDDTDET